MNYSGYWQFWALLAAVFAAMTAILAKIGVSDINSNFATFIRTIVVVVALGALLLFTGEFQGLEKISGKSALFLTLSGLATGCNNCGSFLRGKPFHARMAWGRFNCQWGYLDFRELI